MSEDPIRDSSRNGESTLPVDPLTEVNGAAGDLKREIEQLRVQLAKATAEAESYRRAAYSLLNKQVPYIPPTEEELNDLMYGPRGRSILDIIEELEREGGG